MDGLLFDSIDQDSADWLKKNFEDDEIFDVVRGMARNKAPCPDGLCLSFKLVGILCVKIL